MRAKVFIIWLLLFLLGSGVATNFATSPKEYLMLGIVLCLSSFSIFAKRYLWGSIFGIGLFFISIFHFQSESLVLEEVNRKLSTSKYEYTVIIDEPTIKYEKQQQITARIINKENPGFGLELLIYAPKYPSFEYGEILQFSDMIKKFDEKSGKYKKEGSVGVLNTKEVQKIGKDSSLATKAKGLLFSIRDGVNTALSLLLPEREAGLASGLILGEKSSLSAETKRLLQTSGTMHIIALSGYNITIILGLFQFLRNRYSRAVNLLVPLLFITIFVIMTGAAPSIVRAAIMGSMPMLASFFGRNSNSFSAVLFSATTMVLFNPFLVLYDIGFQLSFTALIGMLYIGPILFQKLLFLPGYISLPVSETLGAQLVSLPILIYYFGTVSVISPISNLIILSLVPLCMLVSCLIGFLGAINLVAGKIVAIPSYIVLKSFNDIIAVFGNLPFAAVTVEIKNSLIIFLFYFLLFDIWFILRRNKKCIRE